MSRVIFHIDLNAFFANAELILDPSLAGKPVAISGTSRRSVVSTASYEARQYGVHSAMPILMAKQKCPDLIVIHGHYHFYSELSKKFLNLIRRYTPNIEQASIDECYADMTEAIKRYEKPLDLAWEIQKSLVEEYQLKCSIGVAPNKFLAKMASDMRKPMGITVLRISDVPQKLWPLPISEMRGVGKKTAPHLEALGIHTIGDLAHYENQEALRPILGKNTETMVERAHGYDDSELVTDWDAKSLSTSTTQLQDMTDYTEICQTLRGLCESLSKRLVKEDKRGKTLTLTIRYDVFRTITRSEKLDRYVYTTDDLYQQVLKLYDAHQSEDPIRLLGVGLTHFISLHDEVEQINLFEKPQAANKTTELLDEINKKFGENKVETAAKYLRKKGGSHGNQ